MTDISTLEMQVYNISQFLFKCSDLLLLLLSLLIIVTMILLQLGLLGILLY